MPSLPTVAEARANAQVTVTAQQLYRLFQALDRHVYAPDLPSRESVPIQGIRAAMNDAINNYRNRAADEAAAALTGRAMVCGSCGCRVDRCKECGESMSQAVEAQVPVEPQSQTETDQDAPRPRARRVPRCIRCNLAVLSRSSLNPEGLCRTCRSITQPVLRCADCGGAVPNTTYLDSNSRCAGCVVRYQRRMQQELEAARRDFASLRDANDHIVAQQQQTNAATITVDDVYGNVTTGSASVGNVPASWINDLWTNLSTPVGPIMEEAVDPDPGRAIPPF